MSPARNEKYTWILSKNLFRGTWQILQAKAHISFLAYRFKR